MLSVSPPDALELRANTTFEALMWAMAPPGDSRELPEAGLPAIVDALIDLECTVYADTAELRATVSATGAVRSSAFPARPMWRCSDMRCQQGPLSR